MFFMPSGLNSVKLDYNNFAFFGNHESTILTSGQNAKSDVMDCLCKTHRDILGALEIRKMLCSECG